MYGEIHLQLFAMSGSMNWDVAFEGLNALTSLPESHMQASALFPQGLKSEASCTVSGTQRPKTRGFKVSV